MLELIKVEGTPALLSVNFDDLKTYLSAELQKYDVVVTADTVSDAKKLATELNTAKKAFDQRRKDEVARVSEPIRVFDEQMKSLVKMCEDGRQKILGQVKRFEDETRALAQRLLEEERGRLWADLEVRAEFRGANLEGLAMLTSVTPGGKLTASVRRELEARVRADKERQDMVERRILELENLSLKAGLAAPLTQDHVARFLEADAVTYEAEVQRIITAELKRQEEAERRIRAQVEREQARRAETRAREAVKLEPQHEATPESKDQEKPAEEPEAPAQPVGAGKVPCRVTTVFETQVPATASNAAIEAQLRKALAAAGITTLRSVFIVKGATTHKQFDREVFRT